MNCKEVNNNFINAIEKSLSTERQSTFEKHLNNCKSCSESYLRFKNVYQSINIELEEFILNPFLAQKAWDKATTKPDTIATIVPFRRSAIFSIAAAGVALGITLGTLLTSSTPQSTINTSEYNIQLADDYFPNNLYSPYEELENND